MKDFAQLKKELVKETRKKVSESVSPDLMIIQGINTIDDLTKVLNTLTKRLREWHAYSLPELDKKITDNEIYCKLISTKTYKELKEEFGKETMGHVLAKEDMQIQEKLAKNLTDNYLLRNEIMNYIEKLMKENMPNTLILTGANIGARLLVSAGSIKRLAMMPASTIQMLGAEKALFRHLKTGARPPKHGFIINHPYVINAGKNKGKIARILADKISHCAKLDYFKGEIIAQQFKDEIEEKLKNI
jgi:nucleolar protein 56